MKTIIARATLFTLFAMGGSGAALAAGDCGMNSNKPCPPPENTFSKEKAYKSMNSNQPTAQQADESLTRKAEDPPLRTDVQARAGEETAAKATLSGVSASDLKVKPKPPKSSAKEPANPVP